MNFDFLDRYLLEETPSKASVVERLLREPAEVPGAAAFYQGIRMLGPRTPDLSLIALRLVLAGRTADDASVVRLRDLVEEARKKGPGREEAVRAYYDSVR